MLRRISFLSLVFVFSCGGNDDSRDGSGLVFEQAGPAVRGGLVDFAVRNLDADNAFAGPPPFLASGAAAVRFAEVSPARLAGTALVDPLAPLGPLRLQIVARNVRGESITFDTSANDDAAPVVGEGPVPARLAPGTPAANQSVAAARSSNLYAAALPGGDQVFVLTFDAVGAALRTTSGTHLVGAAAPPSGKWGEGHLFETTFESATSPRVAIGLLRGDGGGDAFFAVHASDLSGAPSGYEYSMRLALSSPARFSTKEPEVPDTAAAPLAVIDLDGPAYAIDGALDGPDDADYVIFTPKKAGRVFVAATALRASGALDVAIFGNDPGTANCTALVPGAGTTQAEVKAVAGTPYCARVTSSAHLVTAYQLVVTPEL